MNPKTRIAICLAVVLSVPACSTRPRAFSASVQPVAATAPDGQSENTAFATCNDLVRKGHKGNFTAAAASGAAAGAAMLGTTAAVAPAMVSIGSSSAGAGLAAAIPFVGIAAGFGVNRLIRSGRERSYKRNMGLCLHEFGYEVVDWTRMKKKQPAVATLRSPPPAPTVNPPLAASTLAGPVPPTAD